MLDYTQSVKYPTKAQRKILEALTRLDGHLYINEDVPKPYAYVASLSGHDSIRIRTARVLIREGWIEKVETDATSGSFEYALTQLGLQYIGEQNATV